MDVALFKIACSVTSAHIIFLMGIFFIYKTDQKAVIISESGTPVVFTGALVHVQKGRVGVGRRKVATSAPAHKKMSTRMRSVYPVSSLKERPKKIAVLKQLPEVPLFSPVKQEKKQVQQQEKKMPVKEVIKSEVVPELAPTLPTEVDNEKEDAPLYVEEGGEPAVYEPVYSSLMQQWVLPQGIRKGLVCSVRITIYPDGTSSYECTRTSGVLAFDTAVRTALLHARYPKTIKQYTKIVEFRS